MPASNSTVPTRLVICVDGAPYSSETQTNIHRIYAATNLGKVKNESSGTVFSQIPRYFPSLGSADDVVPLPSSIFGQGHLQQIQEVYESCCRLTGSEDEVWMFGFSRGAYVVRAVAGLLHNFGALASAGEPEFGRDFKKMLKELERTQGRRSSITLSPVSTLSSDGFRSPPKIKFIGAFDTVKAVGDSSLFDISLNKSIGHMRHALALHEERKVLAPEYLFPEEFYNTVLKDSKRSFITAWFIGLHPDMGGASRKAGLGLYPLQWMVLEAIDCGLSIDVDGSSRGDVALNPLSVVFPKPSGRAGKATEWSCTTANGITTKMQDLRNVHALVRHDNSYAVKLNTRSGSIRQKKPRDTFTAQGGLLGYCDWAPQGTILHPSVYLLLDEHINISLETKELKLQRHIEDWRERMLGIKDGVVNTGFWLDGDEEDQADPGAIRVLVCGNTGSGKSTLINKTFGVDVTQSSDRMRGIHNVKEEITFDGRPDLVVHDSGGFEAGGDGEFHAIQDFLKEKSASVDVADRLHVIWFCIDITSPRTLQTATEKLFQAVSEYANDVPIIIVATKKDNFLDIEFGARRKELKKQSRRFDEEDCEQYAEERLKERIAIIRSEMESVPGGRLDACVAVSQDDAESIADLSKITSRCFDTDKVRLLYIRAQVSRIDLKIDLALCEISRRYKKLIRSATGTSFAPFGASINRKVSTTQVTKSIIDCFGLPSVSAGAAMEVLEKNVWTTLGTNMALVFAEGFHIIGFLATGVMSGIPFWLVTGSINASYVVPATCRLFLIMASDLTFVLARSFKEVTFRSSGQPNERDVGAAARNYRIRGYSQHVHRDIKRLVPRRNVLKSFRAVDVQQGLEAIFAKYKDKLMEDVDLPLKVSGMRIGGEGDADADEVESVSTEADSTLFSDLSEARTAVAELEAQPAASELPGSRPVAELPVEESSAKRVELAHSLSTVKRPAELRG